MAGNNKKDPEGFFSINPFNGERVGHYDAHSDEDVDQILEQADRAFDSWRHVSLEERCRLLTNAADLLKKNQERYARTMSLEMGKPICESRSEINKCAWVCDFYAENAARFLADEIIESDASESFVSNDPLGTILAIMPWNFPFWQVFRFAAPTLTAGNTGLLKHATNVLGCAKHMEELFLEAGYPEGVFQNLFIHHDRTEQVISSNVVKAVSLTGSERAGRSVAALAGKYLKKTVLELGGSNAYIVWEDADMEQAISTGVTARMLNSGQSCIAAKRFILVGSAYDAFLPGFVKGIEARTSGNPLEEDTQVGPLARIDLAEKLEHQVRESVLLGAKLITGGQRKDAWYEPGVLTDVKPGMPAFDEELFGPVAAVIKAETEDEAFELAARSDYGLGATICTSDVDRVRKQLGRIPDGAVFINELVKSDPRLPFGGTKHSGYGRELSREGIREFVNAKTVYINQA